MIDFREGPKRVSVTELARNFSDFVNRVTFRGESFFLTKGKKDVAQLRPVMVGVSIDDFRSMMKGKPHLTKADADKFAEDLDAIRTEAASLNVRDPWKS